jgi:hypothetical protein
MVRLVPSSHDQPDLTFPRESHLMRIAYTLGLASAATVLLTTAASAQESKVVRSQLPAAVRDTVAARSKGAVVKGFAREVEHGQTFYEAEMTVQGRSKDMLMDSTGVVVEVEEQVTLASLPAAGRSALEDRAGKGRITMIESLVKQGGLVAYEARVRSGTKRSEIQVGPSGEELKREE